MQRISLSQATRQLTRCRNQSLFHGNRLLSSSSTVANESKLLPKKEDERRKILNASLTHVHKYGWTEEAIAQGVLSAGFPPSYIGMMENSQNKPLCLISFFMEECNNQLRDKLRVFCGAKDGICPTHAEVLEFAIRARLGMVEQYVKTKRWHEGMALGAMYPTNAVTTASQLKDLMEIIANGMAMVDDNTPTNNFGSNHSSHSLGKLDQVAIGAVYVATELHMLADTSNQFEDTWSFLKDRVRELEYMATKRTSSGLISPDMAVAASAVASSMGGAVLSLFAPAAKASVNSFTDAVLPSVMNSLQQQPNDLWSMGTSETRPGMNSNDYDFDHLPPFEESNDLFESKDRKSVV